MSAFDAEVAALTVAEFAHLGSDAVFTPSGGAPVACTVTLQGADVIAQLQHAAMVAPDCTIRVPVAQVAVAPKPGDTFSIGGAVYNVLDRARRREDDREVWTVDVERAP